MIETSKSSKMNLGENTYKRKRESDRRRRIVIGEVESEVERSMEWRPYRNLPIAPGLPDLVLPDLVLPDLVLPDLVLPDLVLPELRRPTRSTCEDLGDEDLGIHFDLEPIDPPEELPEGYELGGRPTRSTCEDLGNEDLETHFDLYPIELGGPPPRSTCEDTGDEAFGIRFDVSNYR